MSMTSSTSAAQRLTVAIIGNPNTGKSTIFNALAGVHTRIANFPGVTVEKKIGRVTWDGLSIDLIDLPGTYSLAPRSMDEMVAVDVLLGHQVDIGRLDVVVCIVDASNLERNLYLASQILEIGLPLVLVLNMWDVAETRGISIDVERLAHRLGVPVIPTVAQRKQGLDDVKRAIINSRGRQPGHAPKPFPQEFYRECDRLASELRKSEVTSATPYLVERLMLDVGGYTESRFTNETAADLKTYLYEARQRLKQRGCRVPAVEARVRYTWVRQTLEGIVTHPVQQAATASDKIDRLLTHPVMGLVVFSVLMFLVFQAIYRWAVPFMDAIGASQDALSSLVASVLVPGAFRSLVINGAIAGTGGVIVFLPQIAILFFFIAILEDSGYMARAAFLMDKMMTQIGLSGKSFVPLMSSFACAIPGIMATRVIENRRDRMVTILIAPLMSCSARLPVYLLLIAAFIPPTTYFHGWISLHGSILFAMSSLGALVAIPMAWLLKKTFFPGETPAFVLELPSYKWPSPRIVLSRVFERSKAFVIRAGTLIFTTTIVVWAVGYYPGDHSHVNRIQAEIENFRGPSRDALSPRQQDLARQVNQLRSQLIADSFLGKAGRAIEPIVKPLGWDWKIGVAAIASFPAREVIIATLGTIYSLGGEVGMEDQGLVESMQTATWPDGSKVYNVPVALSIMVFFALCAQCGATLMVIKRETNSWFWPAFTFGYMTILAYIGAFITYQLGMLLI